jgi:hypothetical protein
VHIGAGLNSIVTRQAEGRFPDISKVLDQKQLNKPLFSFRIDPKLFAETLLAINDLLPADANAVDIFFYPGDKPGTKKPVQVQPLIGFCAKNCECDPPLLIEGVIVPLVKDDPKPQKAAAQKDQEEAAPTNVEPPSSWAPPTTEQFQQAKERHPDMLLLFRAGDFYELFEADADVGAKALGLTVTTVEGGRPMAGFPHHQLETYLRKLLADGHRVAICEPGGAEVEQAETMPESSAVEEKPEPPEEKPKRPRRGKKLAVVSSSDEAVG